MQLVQTATLFAEARHFGQFRRGTGLPYITHPVAVRDIVHQRKRSKHLEAILAATVLHDVLEDTPTTFSELVEEFNPLVASLVLEVTSDISEIARIGKLEYQKKRLQGMSSYALVIKLADRLHNISDNPTAKMIADTRELMAYLVQNRKLSATQYSLVEQIIRRVA